MRRGAAPRATRRPVRAARSPRPSSSASRWRVRGTTCRRTSGPSALRGWWCRAASCVCYPCRRSGGGSLLRSLASSVPDLWASRRGRQSILVRYVPGNVFMFLGRAMASQRRGLTCDACQRRDGVRAGLVFCAALVTLGLLLPVLGVPSRPDGAEPAGHPRSACPAASPRVRVPSPTGTPAWCAASLSARARLRQGRGTALLLCRRLVRRRPGCWSLVRGVTTPTSTRCR